VTSSIAELERVIQQNAAASESLASTAEEIAAQAEELRATVSFFKVGDGTHAAHPDEGDRRPPSRQLAAGDRR
jgi:methyl-accepting chemotaxis protein